MWFWRAKRMNPVGFNIEAMEGVCGFGELPHISSRVTWYVSLLLILLRYARLAK